MSSLGRSTTRSLPESNKLTPACSPHIPPTLSTQRNGVAPHIKNYEKQKEHKRVHLTARVGEILPWNQNRAVQPNFLRWQAVSAVPN